MTNAERASCFILSNGFGISFGGQNVRLVWGIIAQLYVGCPNSGGIDPKKYDLSVIFIRISYFEI